jgi:hypothetical protein
VVYCSEEQVGSDLISSFAGQSPFILKNHHSLTIVDVTEGLISLRTFEDEYSGFKMITVLLGRRSVSSQCAIMQSIFGKR